MNHIFFIHYSVGRHLGCFHALAIVNSAAMSIKMHVSFWIILLSGYMPGVGLLDHMVFLFLVFWGTSILFSVVALPTYIPTNLLPDFNNYYFILDKCSYSSYRLFLLSWREIFMGMLLCKIQYSQYWRLEKEAVNDFSCWFTGKSASGNLWSLPHSQISQRCFWLDKIRV